MPVTRRACLENGTWETLRVDSPLTRVSMSGMEFPIHRIEPSGRTAIAGRKGPTRIWSSLTWCRQSEVKRLRSWKCTAARSARRSTGKSPTTRSTFIKRKASAKKPFFAYLPYTQTHEPVDAHPDFKGKTGNGSFADVLAQTDAYVGEILDTIDRLGIKENTIFIFTSDNGREGIKRSFGFTGPWRGTMFSPYEGSLRVPFLIRWPGKIPARQVSNDIVHLVDLFPTLANMVGGEIPKDRILDGVDQTAFLTGKAKKSDRESIVIYIGNELFGVKWRNWKMLIKEIDEDSYAIQKMAYPSIYNLLIDPKEEAPRSLLS